MPIPGGVLPGSGSVYNELVAINRRAFQPACVVQFGKADVALASALAAAEPVYGGVSPITVPVQDTEMVSGAWTGYDGSFSAPQVIPGLSNAEYNLKAFVVGIPHYLFEGLVQSGADIIPLAFARMNSAGNYISDQLSTALWAALSANTSLMPFSLNDVMATTDPTQGALGNRAVATYARWAATSYTIAALGTAGTTWTRVNALAAVMQAQAGSGGEPPSCALVHPGAWMSLASDVIGAEQYQINSGGHYADSAEGVQIGFPAINIGGIPFYADLYATDSTGLRMPNWNYLQYKIHADAAFAIVGPESLLPQFQLGFISALFVLIELVCSSRRTQSIITGFTGATTITVPA